MPPVKICCCLRLRTASFLIAIFELINFSIIAVHSGEDAYVVGYNLYHAAELKHYAGAKPHLEPSNGALVISIGRTLICIVRIVAAVILLFGIQKRKLNLVKCWLWIKVMTLAIATIMILFTLFHEHPDSFTTVVFIGRILLEILFLWVVNKFEIEMKETATRIPKTRARVPPNSVAIPMGSCRIPYNQF